MCTLVQDDTEEKTLPMEPSKGSGGIAKNGVRFDHEAWKQPVLT